MTNNVGTPDWQRGIVTAGKLLATIPAGTTTETVTVPPNAQSLAVVLNYVDVQTYVDVKGSTTGRSYSGAWRPSEVPFSYADSFYYFAVASQLDAQVEIRLSTAPTSPWYVFSESGVTLVDVAELVPTLQPDVNGSYYGITTVGYMAQSQRFSSLSLDGNGRLVTMPPTSGLSKAVAAGTTQLLALPSGNSWYLYGIDVVASAASVQTVTLIDSTGNTIATVSPPASGESKSVDLGGFYTNGSVSVTASAAATVTLRYTLGP